MTLRSHKYAVLLAAIVGVILVESFSHRLLLGPVASDLAVLTTEMLVLLIVFDRRVNRLVGLIAFATAVASALAHYVLPPTYPQVSAPVDLSQCAASAARLRGDRHPAKHLRAARRSFRRRAGCGVRLSARGRSVVQSLHVDRESSCPGLTAWARGSERSSTAGTGASP